MRTPVLVAALVGCGRVGFDSVSDGNPGTTDVPVNPICGARERPTLAMGASNTCVVRIDGSLWCTGASWGLRFTRVDSSTRYLRVDAEEESFCALDIDCEMSCWGNNGNGELGLGDRIDRPTTPTPVMPGTKWRDLGAGGFHTCAIREDRALFCWGRNLEGELGVGDKLDRHVPTRVGIETWWQRIARGYLFTCASDDQDRLWCWGANDSGQLGAGAGPDVEVPQLVPGGPWHDATAGKQHICALDASRFMWCWGLNAMGQLATGDVMTPITSPNQIQGSATWSALAAGRFTTCGLQGGALWCWGDNAFGAVGVPGMTLVTTPARVQPPAAWSAVSPMNVATCAFDAAGDLYCWGENDAGQLGLGDSMTRFTPVRVAFP
jgi:alpha-tubulin suppressor-like RCC1 family protein